MWGVLVDAQRLGYLGPGDLAVHAAHANAFAEFVPPDTRRIIDLGSGGGVPGLVLGVRLPLARITLVDAKVRRVDWLNEAVSRLGLGDRIHPVVAEAQALAHEPEEREGYDVATARGFGPPAFTAEIASGFVRRGGRMIVSEPPDPSDRWHGLDGVDLGFAPVRLATSATGYRFAIASKTASAAPGYPRRGAALRTRPLFG